MNDFGPNREASLFSSRITRPIASLREGRG